MSPLTKWIPHTCWWNLAGGIFWRIEAPVSITLLSVSVGFPGTGGGSLVSLFETSLSCEVPTAISSLFEYAYTAPA